MQTDVKKIFFWITELLFGCHRFLNANCHVTAASEVTMKKNTIFSLNCYFFVAK